MADIYLSRRIVIASAHRLNAQGLTPAENQKLFGPCNSPNSHGHNYIIEVTLKGPVDPKTGILYNLSDLKRIMEEEIKDRFDHKNLDLDSEEFRNLNSTAENIAIVIWKLLEKRLPKGLLYETRVHETENNVAFFRG